MKRFHCSRPPGHAVRIHQRWRHGGQSGVILRTENTDAYHCWYLVRLANGAEAWFGREQFDYLHERHEAQSAKENPLARQPISQETARHGR